MKEALTYSALIMAALGLALNAWAFLRARRPPSRTFAGLVATGATVTA